MGACHWNDLKMILSFEWKLKWDNGWCGFPVCIFKVHIWRDASSLPCHWRAMLDSNSWRVRLPMPQPPWLTEVSLERRSYLCTPKWLRKVIWGYWRDCTPSVQAKLTEKNESHTTVEIRLFRVNVIGVLNARKSINAEQRIKFSLNFLKRLFVCLCYFYSEIGLPPAF